MTKDEILAAFGDINLYYNNCTMHDNLKWMLEKFEVESYSRGYDDGARTTALVMIDKLGELSNWIGGKYAEDR